jgi:hypothetical protein
MKKLMLELDGTDPSKLSMARLTDYLCELAELFGSQDNVHFDSVTEGCVCLNTWVEDDKYPHVLNRVREAAQGVGPKRARKAYMQLSALMEQDRVDGVLQAADANILQFPKAKTAPPPMVVIKQVAFKGACMSLVEKTRRFLFGLRALVAKLFFVKPIRYWLNNRASSCSSMFAFMERVSGKVDRMAAGG